MRTLFAVAAAALTLTACWEDLPPGDFTSVYYWSDVFLDKYADELVVGQLEAGPTPLAHPRAVLLITGVTIKAKWFDPIVARLKRDGFAPVVYEPPELLSGNLFENSAELGDVIDRVLRDSGQEKIDILAECTGGLIARYYIQSLGGEPKVARLVTFVSPQHGVGKAPLAASIAGWPALDDLSPGSAFLEAVNNHAMPQHVPITSIYTCTDEYIQPYDTAIIPGATNIGLSCDGGFTGHFQTFYDPSIYRIMFDALTAPIPGEPVVDDTDDGGTDVATNPDDGDDGTTGDGSTDGTTDVATNPDDGADGATDVATDPDDGAPETAPSDDVDAPSDGANDHDGVATGTTGTTGTIDPAHGQSPEQHVDNNQEPAQIGGVGCAGGGEATGLGAVMAALLLVMVWRRKSIAARSWLTASGAHANSRQS